MKHLLRYRWAHAGALAVMAFGVAATMLLVHPPLIVAVHKGIEGEALKKTIERYSSHGHAFQVVELPYEALRDAVRASVQGRGGQWRFDVVMLDDPWLPELEGGLALFSPEPDDGDFLESCRKVGMTTAHPNQFSAVPYVGNSQLLCYRKDETDKAPPKTWDALVKFSVASNEPDRFGYVMRVKSGNSILTDFLPMLWEADPGSLSGVPLQLGEKARLAFEQVEALGKDRRFATASQDDFDLAAYVLREKTSMSVIWSAWAMQLGNLAAANPGVLKNFEFGQVPGKPVLGAWLLAVSASSKHKDDAEEFVRFATSKDELVNAARDGNPPPRRSVLLNAELQAKYKSFPEQLKSLENAAERPRTSLWSHVEEQVGACLAELSAGLIEVEDAFKGSEDALKRLNHLASLERSSKDSAEAVKLREALKQSICEERRKRRAVAGKTAAPVSQKPKTR